MKKLLYTFLSISIIFTACDKEDEVYSNINNSALAIGDTHKGGVIFYLNTNGGGLIASPSDQSAGTVLGCSGTTTQGASDTAIGTGYQNTIDIEAGCTTSGTAADICANLTLGEYSDWFLPSKDELNQMYINKSVIGSFSNNPYWSSTYSDSSSAWVQGFGNGDQNDANENGTFYVRAIRDF